MDLQHEVDEARADIRTDGYAMSIGELISLYEDNEIDIHPEFQRFYRWTTFQKSRLVESILLGIPIPQIFVSQQSDGVWDVVDGLQRLSTIYELVGVLRNEEDVKLPPLTLEKTKYLPSLEGKKWEGTDSPHESLTSAQRLLIKRAKLDVSIILRESDEKSKYELFQRLNTGGTRLSDQEVRNSILVMMNKDMYRWMRELSQDQNFMDCVSLTDRALIEQYDMDLVLRFLIFRTLPEDETKGIGDINEFLTDKMIEVIQEEKIDISMETEAFASTFAMLNNALGSDSFHKYDEARHKFVGGFLISAFELLAMGIGYNYEKFHNPSKDIDIESVLQEMWMNPEFTTKAGSGVRASSRIPNTLSLGRKTFQP